MGIAAILFRKIRNPWVWMWMSLAVQAAHAAYVVTPQGQTIQGSEIRSKANGDIVLTTDKGPLTFTKGSYVRAVADEPAEYKQAQQFLASKKYDDAVKLLKDIAIQYKNLQWDMKARLMLGEVYAQQGDYENARLTYEDVFRSNPKLKEMPEVSWTYRGVLLKSGKYAILEPELNTLIQSGSREDAAKAQIMRGDLRKEQGQMEPAVMDYMRTMVFFKDVAASQPEAMFKVAEGLESMRDERAKGVYRSLVEQYPDTAYAQQARGKM